MMYKFGDIVYLKKLVFSDNVSDTKTNRPCIVLFSLDNIDGTSTLYVMPVTSKIKAFNKCNKNYSLLPIVIYNERKLNFAKLNNIIETNIENVIDSGISLNDSNISFLKEKLNAYSPKKNKELYEFVKKVLVYDDLFRKLEEREEKKKLKEDKILKKRLAKGKDKNYVKNV